MKKMPLQGSWFRPSGEPRNIWPQAPGQHWSARHRGRVGSFSALPEGTGLAAPCTAHRPEGSATHSEEWVSGILEDPALGDRVGDFIL